MRVLAALVVMLGFSGCASELSDMERCEPVQIGGELFIPEDGPKSCDIIRELVDTGP